MNLFRYKKQQSVAIISAKKEKPVRTVVLIAVVNMGFIVKKENVFLSVVTESKLLMKPVRTAVLMRVVLRIIFALRASVKERLN